MNGAAPRRRSPARAETAEGVVQPARNRDEFSGDGRIQIGTAKPRRALETAILVEHDAGTDQRHQGRKSARRAFLLRYSARFIMAALPQTVRCAGMRRWRRPTSNEQRVALCCPHRREMPDRPDEDTDQPQAETKTDGACQRAVQDRDGAWCAAEQDRFAERRWTGTVKPEPRQQRSSSDQRSAAKREEGQEETRRRESDRQAEHDLNETAEAA